MPVTRRLSRALVQATDQKFLSFDLSILCSCMPEFTGFICKSKAVVLAAFCSSPGSRARLLVEGVGDEKVYDHSILITPIIPWHDPFHELVEQWHRERGVAMARTPDHALDDQLASGRTERGDFAL